MVAPRGPQSVQNSQPFRCGWLLRQNARCLYPRWIICDWMVAIRKQSTCLPTCARRDPAQPRNGVTRPGRSAVLSKQMLADLSFLIRTTRIFRRGLVSARPHMSPGPLDLASSLGGILKATCKRQCKPQWDRCGYVPACQAQPFRRSRIAEAFELTILGLELRILVGIHKSLPSATLTWAVFQEPS